MRQWQRFAIKVVCSQNFKIDNFQNNLIFIEGIWRYIFNAYNRKDIFFVDICLHNHTKY